MLFKPKISSRNLRNPVLIIMLLSLVFFLSSCDRTGPYGPYKDPIYYQGIEGMEIDFLVSAPPDEVYEDSVFNINLYLENRGAHSIVGENYGWLSISFDPYYIETTGIQTSTNVEVGTNGILLKGVQMLGKSRYHPSGSETFLSLPNFKTKVIQGQREKPRTQLFASLCYPYVTHFAELICVDMNLLGQNLRDQVCYQQDLALDDQGAPVAITRIEVENQPAGADMTGNPTIRPIFIIHARNKGSGVVLSPVYNAVEIDRVCSYENLNRDDFNTVEVKAVLSDSSDLECKPNPIKLYNGEGFTRCEVRDRDLIVSKSNYQTPLTVNLSYVYLTSISKDIEIKRINPYGGIRDPPEACPAAFIQDGTGRCISYCHYCAQNPGDGRCQPANSKYHIDFKLGFGCQCSVEKCNKLYPDGMCVPFDGFCVGASRCCLLQCSSSEELLNGKCYPKCDECESDGEEEDCACGSEENGFTITLEGSYCCPGYENNQPSSHLTYDDCDRTCNPDDYNNNE